MHDEPAETATWLRRVQAEDAAAFGELFDHYRPRLKRMVEVRLDPRVAARVDASDVLQEAYLDAERRLPGYLRNPSVSCLVWLRGITWERLLKTHRYHLGTDRRSALRELALPEGSSVLLAEQLFSPATSPSRAVARRELGRLVQVALAKLDPQDREVILLRHFEDLSNLEAAQVLGLTPSGASMRHGRAVFSLKQLLRDESALGDPRR